MPSFRPQFGENDPLTEIAQTVLTKLQCRDFAIVETLSPGIVASLDTDVFNSFLTDIIALRIRGMVYGKRLVDGEVEVHLREMPATWWDMWKSGHSDAARWVRKRWPVKTRTVTFTITLDRWAHYPDTAPTLARSGEPVIVDEVEVEIRWDEV